MEEIDLTGFTGEILFELSITPGTGWSDAGWHIDDVSVVQLVDNGPSEIAYADFAVFVN